MKFRNDANIVQLKVAKNAGLSSSYLKHGPIKNGNEKEEFKSDDHLKEKQPLEEVKIGIKAIKTTLNPSNKFSTNEATF